MIPAHPIQAEFSPAAQSFLRELMAVERRRFFPGDYEPAHNRWQSGQELLDAGLVARTCHADGRVTYRLTQAGQRWRSA